MAQEQLPLNEIPQSPENIMSGNIIARMTQGLGYRYYWATKDLRKEDLNYRPSKEASSTYETLEHIYGLSEMIRNAARSQPIRPIKKYPEDYEALRKETLLLLDEASQLFLGKTDEEVAEMKVIFDRGEKKMSFPLWNLLNGPLSDAIYHTGQIVSFRRTAGNPIQKGVNVFLGKTKL